MRNTSKNKNISYSLDNLCLLTDEQLKKVFLNLRSQINKNKRNKANSRQLEVELCYIQKEIQDRSEYKKNKIKTRAN